jgi:hypothetical protein
MHVKIFLGLQDELELITSFTRWPDANLQSHRKITPTVPQSQMADGKFSDRNHNSRVLPPVSNCGDNGETGFVLN